MCVFGYLKIPDIILSLVSSQKLDWTHTFGTYCMQYEAKRHYYLHSMSMRHKQWVSYQLQCGSHESSFNEKAPEIPIKGYSEHTCIFRT